MSDSKLRYVAQHSISLNNNNLNVKKKTSYGTIQFDHKIIYLVKCMRNAAISLPVNIFFCLFINNQ